MQFRAVVCAAMLIAPGLAAAQLPLPSLEPAPPLNGLYIGAGAGFNWLQNQHLINAAGTAANAALQSRYGWAGVGSLGYALPNGLRFEIEGDYRNNQFSHGRDFGFPAGAGGREIKYGPMFNVLYDMTNLLAQTLLCAICRCRRRLPVGASKWV
jgi:OmpA-OmpF porin, OOP family